MWCFLKVVLNMFMVELKVVYFILWKMVDVIVGGSGFPLKVAVLEFDQFYESVSLVPRLHPQAFYRTVYKSWCDKKLGGGVWERGYESVACMREILYSGLFSWVQIFMKSS